MYSWKKKIEVIIQKSYTKQTNKQKTLWPQKTWSTFVGIKEFGEDVVFSTFFS